MDDLIKKDAPVQDFILSKNGGFPNSELPVLIYKNVLQFPVSGEAAARQCENIFKRNDWGNNWVDSIFTFHHYHSNTHEVLGICNGSVTVQLGGPDQELHQLSTGDVVIIPAGVAHKRINSTADFSCVGGYPGGKSYDMNYGKQDELEKARENINNVPLPGEDPVYGKNGKLFPFWH